MSAVPLSQEAEQLIIPVFKALRRFLKVLPGAPHLLTEDGDIEREYCRALHFKGIPPHVIADAVDVAFGMYRRFPMPCEFCDAAKVAYDRWRQEQASSRRTTVKPEGQEENLTQVLTEAEKAEFEELRSRTKARLKIDPSALIDAANRDEQRKKGMSVVSGGVQQRMARQEGEEE